MAEDPKNDLWGPINIKEWRKTPVVSGRLATEEDVKTGTAVFYLQNAQELGAKPIHLEIPMPAILEDKDDGIKVPVILVQAEEADGKKYVGYRLIAGGNGMCSLDELELLKEIDSRFKR